MLISNKKWMEVQEAFWRAANGDEESKDDLQIKSPKLYEELTTLLRTSRSSSNHDPSEVLQ